MAWEGRHAGGSPAATVRVEAAADDRANPSYSSSPAPGHARRRSAPVTTSRVHPRDRCRIATLVMPALMLVGRHAGAPQPQARTRRPPRRIPRRRPFLSPAGAWLLGDTHVPAARNRAEPASSRPSARALHLRAALADLSRPRAVRPPHSRRQPDRMAAARRAAAGAIHASARTSRSASPRAWA